MLAREDTIKTGSLKVTLDTPLLRRNASPPSHVALQFPVELLQKVFLFLVDACYAEPSDLDGRPVWIAITYVSRYWRSAALSLHELWSSITSNLSISWSQVMIERSAPLPMRIVIFMIGGSVCRHKRLTTSKLLLSACRVRTLTLFSYIDDVLEILNFLRSSSPIESLNLQVDYNYNSGTPVSLPESMYGGDAPHLRRLTIRSSEYIRAPLWLLAGITHITDNSRMPLYELIGTLEAMPQLEVLCIIKILDRDKPDPHNPRPPQRTTTLPHLSLLSIRGGIPESFLALSLCIHGPPTLRRHFFWDANFETWLKWAWTVTVLQDFVPGDSALGANDGGLRIAQICGREYGTFEVCSRTYSESASTTSREDALFLWHVDWSRWSERSPVNSGFGNLSSAFSRIAHIEDLAITPETAIEGIEGAYNTSKSAINAQIIVERLTELLTDLTSVKTLRLHRGTHACVSVLRALSASKDPIFPHLQRVIVLHSAIHSGASDGVRETGAGCSVASRRFVQANVGPELVEAVSGRSGLEVVLAGCEVDEGTLDVLRKEARVYIGHERVYV